MKQGEPKPHSFCETPKEKCTMNYCDTNGCQNRKRELVELQEQFKQETLEESKSNYADIHNEVYDIPCANLRINNRELIENAIEFGAKWQQEQDKNKYSEEEVLNFTQTIIMQYKFGNTNIEQLDLLKETLQLFKNK